MEANAHNPVSQTTDMAGKHVVITEAASGLGAELARRFVAAGHDLAVCGADGTAIEDLAADLEADGGEVVGMRVDVRDEYDVERFLETAARTAGSIDVLITNPGTYHGVVGETALADESYAAFDATLRSNARGVFAMIREAVPHLSATARVLVPSVGVARDPAPGYGTYAVSKAAAEAVARGFAVELDTCIAIVDLPTALVGDTGDMAADDEASIELIEWTALTAEPSTIDGAVVTHSIMDQASG